MKLKDGEELKVGTTRIVALETPGHTPESVTYAVYVKDAGEKCWGAFTGDALFVGDTGRTDLPDPQKTGENAGILYDSVHSKIAPLGDQTLLYPAHGSGSACGGNISDRDDSTIGIEKGTNPVFKKSRKEFVEHKLAEKMARPPYFSHMEEVNLLPGRPMAPPSYHVLQPKDFQKRMKEGLVIDTRSPEAFAGAHIPGSYNIWLDGVPAFGGWLANEKTRIFLVVEGPEKMEQAVKSFARIGIDTVEGVLTSGVETWREQGLPIESDRHHERRGNRAVDAGGTRPRARRARRVRVERKAHSRAPFTSSSAISRRICRSCRRTARSSSIAASDIARASP